MRSLIVIIPLAVFMCGMHHPRGKDPNDKYSRLDKVPDLFRSFENNFRLEE